MKNRKIMKCILGVLYCIPFVAVLGVSAYVTFNNNAKDSYSTTGQLEQVTLNQNTLYIENQTYLIQVNNNPVTTAQGFTGTFDIDFHKYNANIDNEQVIAIYFTGSSLSTYRLVNNNYEYYRGINLTTFLNDTNTFSFVFKRNNTSQVFQTFVPDANYNGYTFIFKTKTLDNAFEYGIDRFNDLGFEKMGFMQYFTDLFVTSPNRYTSFINSYFNYFLLVTCVSVLPRVLYWFIEWAVSFTERFTRKDY